MIMKAKFVLLMAAGLFLATASQAQFHQPYKDSRDGNLDRQEMTYERNEISGSHREMRKDRHELRHDRRKFNKAKRHHRHHGHKKSHRFS
jgi:hypothetical protein